MRLPSSFMTVTSLPLAGKTILVTRSAGQSSPFTTLLQQQGATVLEMPAIAITPPSSWEPLDRAIAQLDQFDWLILTSSNGVDYFFERLLTILPQSQVTAALQPLKIAVVGKKTAQALQQHRISPDFIPPDFVADALIDHFPDAQALLGLKILFPRVESGGRDALVRAFTNQGAIVTEVPAYESGCVTQIDPPIEQALRQGQVDVITFASSKTVRCFAHLLDQMGDRATAIPNWDHLCLASIGPQTSKSCGEYLGRMPLEAAEYTLDGLTDAMIQWANGDRIKHSDCP
jgi:uroporphyrinogen III methyltransferase/synthase